MGKTHTKKKIDYNTLLERRYCFKKKKGGMQLSIPINIVQKLEIKDGEKVVDWQPILHKSEEKYLKVRIIRGESMYDE